MGPHLTGKEMTSYKDVLTMNVEHYRDGRVCSCQAPFTEFETTLAYDGGVDGLDIARRAVSGARERLRPGGALLLELGGRQAEALAATAGDSMDAFVQWEFRNRAAVSQDVTAAGLLFQLKVSK